MLQSIKVIGFDADDTLWINEPFYQDVEREFCQIMKCYLDEAETSKELFKTEMQNLEIYGYGAKGFILAMVETAIRITDAKITSEEINRIIDIGKTLLNMPIQLLDGVENVLQKLRRKYKLILATKGDLLDQERKLQKSELINYFHHIEIMSDKHENNYRKLLSHLDIQPSEFLMVGNSVKSDILPVLNIGASAIHVPFEVIWQHETHHDSTGTTDFSTVSSISEILELL
ncbi:hydrolase, haloacid dehalogenase-like family [Aquipluma nitroreducens]|uniref:Hydrolase, haloacid dehalogenase-like family n=1 Tax=Aquipluma nitroreducens TaxID=2010828 RepID=A0A5K7SG29_9BACT|nr:HAD family hydrolase [Aquipluma nitroreducens]BBE20538.1 hydrolase, haloacid dehalogenase-like family [Aquipluma nitroreducens]